MEKCSLLEASSSSSSPQDEPFHLLGRIERADAPSATADDAITASTTDDCATAPRALEKPLNLHVFVFLRLDILEDMDDLV